MKTKLSKHALHGREYRFETLPNSGWRFLQAGEQIKEGDYAYHVTDSTFIPCQASVGRIVDGSDGGNTYIRLVGEDNVREEELRDLKAKHTKPRRVRYDNTPAFTPSPWLLESGWTVVAENGSGPRIVAKVENCFTAQFRTDEHFSPETTKANALLIVAAPSLFDELVFAYDARKDDDGRWVDRNGDYVRVLNKAEGVSIPA